MGGATRLRRTKHQPVVLGQIGAASRQPVSASRQLRQAWACPSHIPTHKNGKGLGGLACILNEQF